MMTKPNSWLFVIGCLMAIHTWAHPSSDSIYTMHQVMRVHITEPDSAMNLLRVMEARRLQPLWRIQSVRGIVCMAQYKYRAAILYAQHALANDSLRRSAHDYLHTLSYQMEAHQHLGNYKTCLKLIEEGLRFAHQKGDRKEEAKFLFSYGRAYYYQGEAEKAYKYFAKAIEICEHETYPHIKANLMSFYEQLSTFLVRDHRIEEAWEYCVKWENMVKELQSDQKGPLGFIDRELSDLYIKQAYVLERLGRSQEAAGCYQKYLKVNPQRREGTYDEYAIRYWLLTQRYSQVVFVLNKAIMPEDTLNHAYAAKLDYLAEAYRGVKDYEQAYFYQKRHDVVTDKLNLQLKKDAMAELTTFYQLQEKDWFIERQHAKIEHAEIVRNGLAGAFVLLCALMGMMIHYTRTIKKKNQLMVVALNQMRTYQDKIDTLEDHLSTQMLEQDEDADLAMFRRIEKMIKDNDLFLHPDLNRQELLDELGIDKNYFSKLMQKYVQMTLPQYLVTLRINYAIHELKEHPNYTIQAVSDSSGFTNVRHFQRSFKATTGMTPSEYKAALLKSPNV